MLKYLLSKGAKTDGKDEDGVSFPIRSTQEANLFKQKTPADVAVNAEIKSILAAAH